MEKPKLDRIISIATLAAAVVAIVLALKRPATVTVLPAPADTAAIAQPSNRKVDPPESGAAQGQQIPQSPQPQASGGYAAPQAPPNSQPAQSPKAEPSVNSQAISAAINQLLGAGGTAGLSPESEVGSGTPNIKDQNVTYEGDMVHGKFLTEIAGKDVWVTISGHMGEKDGYATFDPTEFKVGDVSVPVSLVNPALQRKLAEERDHLKLADPASAK